MNLTEEKQSTGGVKEQVSLGRNWVDCVALTMDTTGLTILQDKSREEGMRRGAEGGGRGVQLLAVLSCLLFEAAELTSVHFLFFHSQENLLVL